MAMAKTDRGLHNEAHALLFCCILQIAIQSQYIKSEMEKNCRKKEVRDSAS